MGIGLTNTAGRLLHGNTHTAARELKKLKHGNRDISPGRYYAGFVRLVTMIPDMSDKSRNRALEKGLLDSLQHIPTDGTLAGFVDRLERMDGQIRRRKGRQASPRQSPPLPGA